MPSLRLLLALLTLSLAAPLQARHWEDDVATQRVSTDPDSVRIAGHLNDLWVLQETLEERHPDLYAVTPRETLEEALDAVRDSIAVLSDMDISVRLRAAVALLGDPHTNATFLDAFDFENLLPFEFAVFEEGVFVTGAYPEHQALLGSRLVAIEGTTVEALQPEIARFVAAGRPQFALKRFPVFLRYAELHRYLGADVDDGVTLDLIDPDGQPRAVTIEPIPGQADVARLVYLSEEIAHPTWVNHGEEDPALAFRDLAFDDGIYVVQYSSCWGRELEARFGDADEAAAYPSFEAFADRVVERLSTGEVETLVVDLRANSGGSSPQGTRLAQRMAALPEDVRPRRVVVALSEQTFSSAVINAMDFRLMTGAEFVGTPTGGAPNHFGEVKVFRLPYSGQVVAHSTAFFGYMNGDPTTIRPDRTLVPRFADFLAGEDPVLDYVRATR
ncbi:MAG: hypothetical protein AAGG50_06480 [Bacteroidota bacterium]